MIMAGIYVGEGWVIHFIPTEINGLSKQKHPCAKCGYQHNFHLGVVKTCLDCFLSKHALCSNSLCLYQYEESWLAKKWKRAGSCSSFKFYHSKPLCKLLMSFINIIVLAAMTLLKTTVKPLPHFVRLGFEGVNRSLWLWIYLWWTTCWI